MKYDFIRIGAKVKCRRGSDKLIEGNVYTVRAHEELNEKGTFLIWITEGLADGWYANRFAPAGLIAVTDRIILHLETYRELYVISTAVDEEIRSIVAQLKSEGGSPW